MCLQIIQPDVEIPHVMRDMYLVRKTFAYDIKTKKLTSTFVSGNSYAEGYAYKFEKKETDYGIECKVNNTMQRVEQLQKISGNTLYTQFYTKMGYHCFIPRKFNRKVRHFSIHPMCRTKINGENEIENEILYHHVRLPILIKWSDIQFCIEKEVIVDKFTIPNPEILLESKHKNKTQYLTKIDIKTYAEWYIEWRKK